MSDQTISRPDDRGIDGSRMADYVYGRPNGYGKTTSFHVTRAYQEGHPWIYADYYQPPVKQTNEEGPCR